MYRLVEAYLFIKRVVRKDELCRKLKLSKKELNEILKKLKRDYENRAFQIEEAGELIVFGLKREFQNYFKLKPELGKGLLETLALIAANAPIKLSKLAKLRGSKAYEHVKKLKEKGFIKVRKFRRTYLIEPSEKFYLYFQLK